MALFSILTRPLANQEVSALLADGNQIATIHLYVSNNKLHADVKNNDTQISAGYPCYNRQTIIPFNRSSFIGDLYFIDTTGQNRDPQYELLGTEFLLVWDDGA